MCTACAARACRSSQAARSALKPSGRPSSSARRFAASSRPKAYSAMLSPAYRPGPAPVQQAFPSSKQGLFVMYLLQKPVRMQALPSSLQGAPHA